jgi:hypothetical protein
MEIQSIIALAVNNLQANNVKTNIKDYGKEQPARWLSVDPMVNKYPGWSPYNYALNNPLRFIDPNGDTVKFKSDEIQKMHTDFYNQKNEDGTYTNQAYRDQYNTLNASEVVYDVVDANLGGKKSNRTITAGNTTTDGQDVIFQLDLKNGATIGGTLSHEFVHGIQFENNECWFINRNGTWGPTNMSIDLEYKAFAGQQIKIPEWQNDPKKDMKEVQSRYSLDQSSPLQPIISPTGIKQIFRNSTTFIIYPAK